MNMLRPVRLPLLTSAIFLLVAASGCATATPAARPTVATVAQEAESRPIERLDEAVKDLDAAIVAIQAGEMAKGKQAYLRYDDEWEEFENGVKAHSVDVFFAIESS